MISKRSRSRDASPTDRDEPGFISLANGKRVAYEEYGDPAGLPVLFFHGTPGSRLSGALFDDQAAERGVRILAFDRPGFGQSPPWRDQPDRDVETVVGTLLDELDVETARLIAFSGGSRYAVAAAATESRISRVDVVSGATPPDVRCESPLVQRMLSTAAVRSPTILRGVLRGQTWLARRLDPPFVVSQYTAGDPEEAIPDRAAEIVKEDFVEALSKSRRGTVTELRETATRWEVDLEQVDTEIRLWHGEADTNVPIECARQFASRHPRLTLQTLEDADHIQALLESVPMILNEYR